jgi:hypothetical protein
MNYTRERSSRMMIDIIFPWSVTNCKADIVILNPDDNELIQYIEDIQNAQKVGLKNGRRG